MRPEGGVQGWEGDSCTVGGLRTLGPLLPGDGPPVLAPFQQAVRFPTLQISTPAQPRPEQQLRHQNVPRVLTGKSKTGLCTLLRTCSRLLFPWFGK